jgi:uncharacterized protein
MKHASHPEAIARLKRAHGHLASVIQMIEAGRPCSDLAQQLQAVEKAVGNAKRELIRDHIDNCLEGAAGLGGRRARSAMAEVKAITKYL